MENIKGKLYIVGTPIGNMGDITLRALDTLKFCDVILAEDTRQTLKLLNRFEISKPLISYHRHNEDDKIGEVIDMLDNGKNLALVSDAGMPRISDPGESLIHTLINKNYKIEVIPGVTALTTAVVMSNLDSDTFVFEGFLPMRPTRRHERLNKLKYETRMIIFYEAPHKLLSTLKDLKNILGNRKIVIARELTKIHEEYRYSNIEEQIDKISKEGIKGEIVLMVEGNIEGEKEKKEEHNVIEGIDKMSNKELVEKYIKDGNSKKDAIKKVAKERGLNKNEVYMECVYCDKR